MRGEEEGRGCLYDGSADVETFTEEELEEILSETEAGAKVARGAAHVLTRPRSHNFSRGRRMTPPFGIVLHHTGGSFAGDLATLTKRGTGVSANDFITKDGRIFELCEFPKRAWHAGDADLHGITDWNTHGWGIEIENLGNGRDPYPEQQIEAVIWRCRERRRLLGITDQKMLTRHRDIAVPRGRKSDTSDNFPFQEVRRRVFATSDATGVGTPDVPVRGPAVTTGEVRLRRRARANAKTLAVLPRGTTVRILDASEPGWRRVELVGYVPEARLRRARPQAVTPESELLAEPRVSRQKVEAYMLSRSHGRYTDADVRTIIGLYFEATQTVGLDPLLVVAQMILETGNLTSFWSQRPRRNPAGIGVTGQPGAGVSFPSWQKAVRAHVGRLLAYALRVGQENNAQRRLIEEALTWRPLPARFRGAAPTLGKLSGRWAADREYADKIARIANEIRAAG